MMTKNILIGTLLTLVAILTGSMYLATISKPGDTPTSLSTPNNAQSDFFSATSTPYSTTTANVHPPSDINKATDDAMVTHTGSYAACSVWISVSTTTVSSLRNELGQGASNYPNDAICLAFLMREFPSANITHSMLVAQYNNKFDAVFREIADFYRIDYDTVLIEQAIAVRQLAKDAALTKLKVAAIKNAIAGVRMAIQYCIMKPNTTVSDPQSGKQICQGDDTSSGVWPNLHPYGATYGGCTFKYTVEHLKNGGTLGQHVEFCVTMPNKTVLKCTETQCE